MGRDFVFAYMYTFNLPPFENHFDPLLAYVSTTSSARVSTRLLTNPAYVVADLRFEVFRGKTQVPLNVLATIILNIVFLLGSAIGLQFEPEFITQPNTLEAKGTQERDVTVMFQFQLQPRLLM